MPLYGHEHASSEKEVKRISKVIYYLTLAEAASMRSTCINKQWGAIIVKNDEIISSGYNGSPRGMINCCSTGSCFRLDNNIPRGTHYETCRSVHAEANAIISASRDRMIHGQMYIYGWDVLKNKVVDHADSCMMCKRMIINAGIDEVFFADVNGIGRDPGKGTNKYGYRVVKVADWTDDDILPPPGEGY